AVGAAEGGVWGSLARVWFRGRTRRIRGGHGGRSGQSGRGGPAISREDGRNLLWFPGALLLRGQWDEPRCESARAEPEDDASDTDILDPPSGRPRCTGLPLPQGPHPR